MRRILSLVLLALALSATGDAQSRRETQKPREQRAAVSFIIRGAEANAWSAAAVAINGTSAVLDSQYAPFCSAFGNTSAAATLTVQLSQDGTTFYTSGTTTGSVTGNFGINFTTGARYVRLISNAAATITATLACKSA